MRAAVREEGFQTGIEPETMDGIPHDHTQRHSTCDGDVEPLGIGDKTGRRLHELGVVRSFRKNAGNDGNQTFLAEVRDKHTVSNTNRRDKKRDFL
jgi:hypothetical protein